MRLRSRLRLSAAVLFAGVLACAGTALAPLSADGSPIGTGPTWPVTGSGVWMTDAQGRAVILHGLNQVFKVPPYTPGAAGFGEDDAAFLQANGFDAMRVGVIWAAVEPTPGHYDDTYLNSVATTVQTLAAHGIVSLLDFHQDLFNEKFQGEGAPAWAVQDGGLPNPALGFPWNYFGNLAEDHAWDAFWQNAPASDGVGLQTHYARAWKHVAARFAGTPGLVGYEVMNEPWPGTLYEPCAVPLVGCPVFDATLTAFYQRVRDQIRLADTKSVIWIEPNVLFSNFDATHVGKVHDAHIGWSFHDYCGTASIGLGNTGCTQLDQLTVSLAQSYSKQYQVPWLLTEFGATNDLGNLAEMTALADKQRLGWLEWAYTGNDITSSSPNGQALVLDTSQPPTGANVLTDKLKVLAEPYPQAVSGTPKPWTFANGVLTFSYSTVKPANPLAFFPAGSLTDISTPVIEYPNGYTVTVSGGTVVSAPNASILRIASKPFATTVQVTVTPVS